MPCTHKISQKDGEQQKASFYEERQALCAVLVSVRIPGEKTIPEKAAPLIDEGAHKLCEYAENQRNQPPALPLRGRTTKNFLRSREKASPSSSNAFLI